MTIQWIDGHLDLAYLALKGRDLTRPVEDPDEGCVSLPALREANVRLALGTLYTEKGAASVPYGYADSDDRDGAERAGWRELEVYESLEAAGEILIVRTRADLERETDALKVVVLMEGADPIRSPEAARAWFDRGVRVVGLTWGAGTRYAGGNAWPGPLTPEGRELVAALDELGIVHDVSHLADAAVEGLFGMSRGPIVASHSNCRTLLEPNQRHLPDEFIREIHRRGGIVGVNLYIGFLTTDDRRATISDVVRHVTYAAHVTGSKRAVALGSDADGGFTPARLPENLDHPTRFSAIPDALRRAGWTEDEVSGFTHRNWHRFLREALPAE
jgi:membrane dipeptidase